jgi:hypothetical protein
MSKLNELKAFLGTMTTEVKGTVHVNGSGFPNAVLTVDFGNPLTPTKLVQHETNILTSLMRDATREMVRKKETSIRVSADTNNGLVYWTSI